MGSIRKNPVTVEMFQVNPRATTPPSQPQYYLKIMIPGSTILWPEDYAAVWTFLKLSIDMHYSTGTRREVVLLAINSWKGRKKALKFGDSGIWGYLLIGSKAVKHIKASIPSCNICGPLSSKIVQ